MQEEWETPEEQEEKPETFKQKLAEACVFIDDAAEEKENYAGSERLLAYARRLKERVLGPEHLEVAELDNKLAEVCAWETIKKRENCAGKSRAALWDENFFLSFFASCDIMIVILELQHR